MHLPNPISHREEPVENNQILQEATIKSFEFGGKVRKYQVLKK